jgi:hypothetical protein
MAQCKDCRSYVHYSNKEGWGQCRRYPPAWKLDNMTLTGDTEGKSGDMSGARYHLHAAFFTAAAHPDAHETDWCGEFQVRQLPSTTER